MTKLASRLVGLETEYATLVVPDAVDVRSALSVDKAITRSSVGDAPAAGEVFRDFCRSVRAEQPTVRGIYDADQLFLANGGSVSFESHADFYDLPGGLIEVATPELSSPNELLASQASLDQMVADAASNNQLGYDLRVLKNSSDSVGHYYGCQENYEANVASGVWLLLYRMMILVLWAFQVVELLLVLPVFAMITLVVLLRNGRKKQRPDRSGSAEDPEGMSAAEQFAMLPSGLAHMVYLGIRWLHLPTILLLKFVITRLAFRKQRKYLTSLLVSRIIVCGAGDLLHGGRFRISAKAIVIDSHTDYGGFRGERPIFVFGHWLSALCATSLFTLRDTAHLLKRKQRLQIGLSDSNASQLAEYVKLGQISLVLDMIEAGQTQGLPILRRPLRALDRFNSDWNLISRAKTDRGDLSALEIQSIYHAAATTFVNQQPLDERGEATVVLSRWREALDALRQFRNHPSRLDAGLGKIDWMTKKWLMGQIGSDATPAELQKVNLRYHELSPDGYHRRMAEQHFCKELVSESLISKRRRMPPADGPASARGRWIREFAGSSDPLQADWRFGVVGTGRQRKRVYF